MANTGAVSDANGVLVTGEGGQYPNITRGQGGSWAVTYDRNYGSILFTTIGPK